MSVARGRAISRLGMAAVVVLLVLLSGRATRPATTSGDPVTPHAVPPPPD